MMRYRAFARRARAILTERDYAAALAILMASAPTASGREDEERLEALLRELMYYDSQFGSAQPEMKHATQLRAEGRMHPAAALGRRWSDRRT